MSLSEQLNELDRKVLGAAPVDRAEPAAPYDPSVGELAPLKRTLAVRAALYALGAGAIGVHLLLGGDWKTLLVVVLLVSVPSMLVAKLSTNAFPAQFPDAPPEALATGKVGRSGRLALAVTAAAVCLLDLLLLSGKGEELLFVLAGVPAVLLWAVQAEVTSREEDGFVLASRVRPQGRLGKGIYRVPTS
jgi:hypothetical protein